MAYYSGSPQPQYPGVSSYGTGTVPYAYAQAYSQTYPQIYPQTYPQAASPYINRELVLRTVQPWVQYGLHEAQKTSYQHALTEVAVITYLIGLGLDPQSAHKLAESWEVGESYPLR